MTSKNAVRKLREIYLDENVIIYLRDMNVVAVNESQGEIKISPMLEGYVVDVDQDYVYLGLPDGTILKTIPHATIGLIEVALTAEEMLSTEMAGTEDEVH